MSKSRPPQRVRDRPVAFHDDRDSHRSPIVDAGVSADTNRRLPRVQNVHRSPWSLHLEDPRSKLAWGVWGLAPMRATVADTPRWRALPRLKVSPPLAPLKARIVARKAVQASWAEFNRLRADPRVAFCQRRKERREILFAKRIAGRKRSPGRGGTYHRNVMSQWSC